MSNINIDSLIEIAEAIERADFISDLKSIKCRYEQPEKQITIPLVGEFSSGKTSLINSLIDNSSLETASKATTATIFEIHFGSNKPYAVIHSEEQEIEVTDFTKLKNDSIGDCKMIRVFDTSAKVPSSTVLVDTPGISSNDPRHRIALVSYLPFADAIFLVADINQQLTKSLLNFVETTNLSEKPVFLILTKSDTKNESEITAAKQYASKCIIDAGLKVEDIIVISSKQNSLNEFNELLAKLQLQKNRIVYNALNLRLKAITESMSDFVLELIEKSESTDNLEMQIDQAERKLDKIKRNINRLIQDAESSVEEIGNACINRFAKTVTERLETVVRDQGRDIDEQVYAAVNMVATQNIDFLKRDIQIALIKLARNRKSSEEAVPLQFLESFDLSSVSVPELSYDLNLASLGHKHDKLIGYAAMAAAAAATVWIAGPALVSGAATGRGAAQLAGGMVSKVGKKDALEVVDIATDVVNIQSNARTVNRIRNIAQKTATIDRTMQNFTPQQRGMLETSVGWVTDKLVGKPQRKKAIHLYVDETLKPEYKTHIGYVTNNLTQTISTMLQQEAQEITNYLKNALTELKTEETLSKEAYDKKIEKLKEFREFLQNDLTTEIPSLH